MEPLKPAWELIFTMSNIAFFGLLALYGMFRLLDRLLRVRSDGGKLAKVTRALSGALVIGALLCLTALCGKHDLNGGLYYLIGMVGLANLVRERRHPVRRSRPE